LFNQRGVQSGYSAQASAQLSDAAMAAAIDRAIEELTPAEAKLFVQEKVLITRFYEQFAEEDSERAELQRVLGDAATTDRDATLSIYYRTSIQSANNQQARAKSADAFLKILSQNAEYYKKREREERRNYAIAQELEKFANVKGERADIWTTSTRTTGPIWAWPKACSKPARTATTPTMGRTRT
jgi:vacuolar-type H+-ATPase subunit I/STV1